MFCYTIEPRDKMFMKGYGLSPFAKKHREKYWQKYK